MTISSMTGFARTDGVVDGVAWIWEARSVNGRGLDVRLRLPPGNEAIEVPSRDAVARRFTRGNIALALTMEKQQSAAVVRLNETVLADVLKAVERVKALNGDVRPTDAAQLLMVKGVLEYAEPQGDAEAERSTRERALLAGLDTVLDKLAEARRAEGARLLGIVNTQVSTIETLAADVRRSPSRTPEAILQRLRDALARLADATSGLDGERLHQEAVLLATRADVEEELQRLGAHVAAAREMLAETGAVGRKLDFLAQEFNREANTLCSKANAVDVTRLGLQLKTVIDQFREQVQNIE